jgi:hypothetical protein
MSFCHAENNEKSRSFLSLCTETLFLSSVDELEQIITIIQLFAQVNRVLSSRFEPHLFGHSSLFSLDKFQK